MPKQQLKTQIKKLQITVARQRDHIKSQDKKIMQLAYHDMLTGLPNRRMLLDRYQQLIAIASRHKSKIAILFFDLDQFKHVNDNYGHDIGDLLLIEIGRRLSSLLRKSDTIARIGGDEFIILLSDIKAKEDAAFVTAKILSYLRNPFMLDGSKVKITASIGISIYPDDNRDLETLIKKADSAMRAIKSLTRNDYRFFKAA